MNVFSYFVDFGHVLAPFSWYTILRYRDALEQVFRWKFKFVRIYHIKICSFFAYSKHLFFCAFFFHGISTIHPTKKNTKVWLWRRPGEGSSTSCFQNGAPVFCTKSYCWLWTTFPDAHGCIWRTDRSTSRYVGIGTSVFLDPNSQAGPNPTSK